MSGMTDMVTMLLILGAGYYAWQNGLLDQLVEQVKGMGTPTTPTTEEAAPAPEAEPAADTPTEAEPAADTPTEAEPAADSGGGGGGDDKAADSGGGGEDDKAAEDDKKDDKKKSDYATYSTYYTVPMNWK